MCVRAGEVSEMVALMTRGRLGSPLSAFGSSDSEDVAEQQLHLQDRYSVNGYQESETKKSSDLEQLFKSFAGNRAVAEIAFKGTVHLKNLIVSSFTDPHAIHTLATVYDISFSVLLRFNSIFNSIFLYFKLCLNAI